MKIFITLVGLITLWSTSLNSGSTNQIWVSPTSDKQATIMASLIKNTDGKTTVVPMVNSEELECMSKNIYFEAAMESTAGKLAVAQVTMNRVNSSRYPNTVCQVIHRGDIIRMDFQLEIDANLVGIVMVNLMNHPRGVQCGMSHKKLLSMSYQLLT